MSSGLSQVGVFREEAKYLAIESHRDAAFAPTDGCTGDFRAVIINHGNFGDAIPLFPALVTVRRQAKMHANFE